jgi:hypothetical protein
MTAYKWQFSARFRRAAFGWRSDAPIQRIKEAISEIKQVSRREPVLAADGVVQFLEKLSPAIEQVDGSSGAIGTAVNRAIETLVPIIAKADVGQAVRQKWLERLWDAVENDEVPYLEVLGNFWGELCGKPEIASRWADAFLPTVQHVWSASAGEFRFFKGTTACLSALHAAGRNEELLSLLGGAHRKWWNDRRWGVKALVSLGRNAEAVRYAEESRGLNTPTWDIARVCEEIMLSSGLADEAYSRYALEASLGTTNLATFRAITKKYPTKSAETILRDLVANQPGQEGKWFAAAKHANLFDVAIELASKNPGDPRTLIRATKDYAQKRPDFAAAAGLIALRDVASGYGYEITGAEILEAYSALMQAASAARIPPNDINARVRAEISGKSPSAEVVRRLLREFTDV